VTFRRILAEAKYDMDKLQALWTEGKREALETEVKKLEELKEEDYEEMVDLLDSHFDPEKQVVKPVVQRRDSVSNGDGTPHQNGNGNNMRRRRRGPRGPRGRSLNKENRGGPREQGGQRMDNRRKRSSDKRFNNNDNNNNNNMMDHQKGGVIRKEHQQQVDLNQNNMVSAN
jgi:Exuperantia SAM-like domain